MKKQLRAFFELMRQIDEEMTITIHLQREKPRVTVTRKK